MKFEIHLADTDVTGGSIPVTWCLDKELLDKIKKTNQRAWVVFAIVHLNQKKEIRRIVPLEDMVTYLTFSCAGPVKIFATIDFGTKKSVYSMWLRPGFYSHFNTEIIFSDDDGSVSYCDNDYYNKAEPIEVVVPKGMFAKDPPKWEQVWVNHFYDMRPNDQCSYRKRRIFAYTIQPILMTVNILARIVVLIWAIIWGMNSVSLKYIIHPLTYRFDETINGLFSGRSFAWKNWDPEKFWELPIRSILTPASWLILSFMYFIGKASLFSIGSIIVGFIIGFPALILAIGFTAGYVSKQQEMPAELPDPILCTGTPKTAKELLKRAPIKLRMQQIKSKVCRPFQG